MAVLTNLIEHKSDLDTTHMNNEQGQGQTKDDWNRYITHTYTHTHSTPALIPNHKPDIRCGSWSEHVLPLASHPPHDTNLTRKEGDSTMWRLGRPPSPNLVLDKS